MSDDLIRRLDSAISTKSLHPEYARGLLREAREALANPRPHIPYAGRYVPRATLFEYDDNDDT